MQQFKIQNNYFFNLEYLLMNSPESKNHLSKNQILIRENMINKKIYIRLDFGFKTSTNMNTRYLTMKNLSLMFVDQEYLLVV